ncbi:hypothetical protein PHMEG_00037049 [Phytophthora megakarya]|uniref:Uncharacterized protein n=1 Tax=Phytophthora megakarya TaxID=4795 RepID=A0A225ULV1_9STRA|nr:hypothetical protein PHMEG_00037049 [Phytophthora megakarya]
MSIHSYRRLAKLSSIVFWKKMAASLYPEELVAG